MIAERDGTIWSLDRSDGTQRVFNELNLASGRELIDIASDVIGGFSLFPVALIRDNSGMYLATGLNSGGSNEFMIASGDPDGARGSVGYITGNAPGGSGWLLVAIGDPGGQRAQTAGGYGSASFLPIPDISSTAGDLIPFATGLRNPSAIFNAASTFFLADQGGSEEHEINLLQSVAGQQLNFGWPFVEGTVTVASGAPSNLTSPEFTYRFGTSKLQGQGVRGGVAVNSGFFVPASLTDRLIIGDENGSIFAFGLTSSVPGIENRSDDLVPDVGTIDSVVDIERDAGGRIYILDADGELFLIESA